MPLTIVHHDITQPALFAGAAAITAHALNARLCYLAPRFDLPRHADAQQHVGSDSLLPSGLIWQARMGASCEVACTVDDLLESAQWTHVVMPWHRAWFSPQLLDTLRTQAATLDIEIDELQVSGDSEHWHFASDAPQLGAWHRDRYGRPARHANETTSVCNMLTIALMGSIEEQRNTYPANLAALGDAADALGITLDIHCIPASALDTARLEGMAGIVLPGGASMHNVAGQIEAAQYALNHHTPLVGLCLGMQTLTTAVARSLPGGTAINLAEAAADAPIKSFVPMREFEGLPAYRVGMRTIHPHSAHGQSLGLDGLDNIHCNHRFMLNPDLRSALDDAGLKVAATDSSGQIVDAVRLDGHPFYAGMQGHPELASRAGAAHPLLLAFLSAAMNPRA